MYVHRTEFMLHGGDRRWLTAGSSSDCSRPHDNVLPFKLHNLQQLNSVLAHRPWTLDHRLISVSELAAAAAVLSELSPVQFSPDEIRWDEILRCEHDFNP